jgi:hypothetical protein
VTRERKIDALSLDAHARRKDPIDTAIGYIEIQLGWRRTILEARTEDPDAFPSAAWERTDDASMAGRIVAGLLDAGWTPPDSMMVAAELRRAAVELEATTVEGLKAEYGNAGISLSDLRTKLIERAAEYRCRADEIEATS